MFEVTALNHEDGGYRYLVAEFNTLNKAFEFVSKNQNNYYALSLEIE